MAGIDASEDNLDELIEAAMFESPPKQPSKSRKSRKAATKEKRYDTKIVSSDEEDAFDDYGDEEEFMSDDDEDDDDEDHDVDDDDDDDDDDGQRDTPTRSMSIESPQDVLSRDTLSAIAAATDESPDRILVRANGERQVVDVKKCLVAAGKVVDKIRTEDMTASDIALFWFEGKDDVPPYSVHAVVVCNDRMKGKMEYHELDNAGETTIVRNTVGLQRVPWPKLCAEQQRWDAFTKDEAISCKIDKTAMQFPVHGVGGEKKRRIFIVSSSFIETRRKRIASMKAKRAANKTPDASCDVVSKPVAVALSPASSSAPSSRVDIQRITKPSSAPPSRVDTLKITDTRTSKVPIEETEQCGRDISKKSKLVGLLKKRRPNKAASKQPVLKSVTEERSSPRKSAQAKQSEPTGNAKAVVRPVAAVASAAAAPVTPNRPTRAVSPNAPPRVRRAESPPPTERAAKRSRGGYCVLVYPSDSSMLDKVAELLQESSRSATMRFE